MYKPLKKRGRRPARGQLHLPGCAPGQRFLSDPEPVATVLAEVEHEGDNGTGPRVETREVHAHAPLWIVLAWAGVNGIWVTLRRKDV